VTLPDLFIDPAIALGLGLLVGLQRESRNIRAAGLRTFALVTLAGALAAQFGDSGFHQCGGVFDVGSHVFHLKHGMTDHFQHLGVCAFLFERPVNVTHPAVNPCHQRLYRLIFRQQGNFARLVAHGGSLSWLLSRPPYR